MLREPFQEQRSRLVCGTELKHSRGGAAGAPTDWLLLQLQLQTWQFQFSAT